MRRSKADLHVHTIFSIDSLITPEKLLRVCKRKGIDIVAITDHNTIKGSMKFRKVLLDKLIIIPGIEVKTNYGDLILLFVEEEIKVRDFFEVIDLAKERNYLTILPHPFRGHKKVNEIARFVDFIEVLNSRTPKKYNLKAAQLANFLKKRISVGSDAHFSFEIGTVFLEFPEVIKSYKEFKEWFFDRNSELVIRGGESSPLVHLLSFSVNIIRKSIKLIGKT